MCDDGEKQRATAAIHQVFEVVGVTTVVFVDDVSEIEQGPDAESIIGMVAAALELPTGIERLEALLPEIPFSFEEVWRLRLREQWPLLGQQQRKSALDILAELLPNFQVDTTSPTLLKDLIPPDVKILELTPRSWQQSRDSVLDKASDRDAVLCLFDQSLEFSQVPGLGLGIDLLKSVVADRGERRVICALLTHTVSEEQESARTRELTQNYGLRSEELLVISKRRLSSAPMGFAHSLKRASLNYLRDSLTVSVNQLAQSSSDEANQQFQALDVDDFDHVVLQSSEREGVWEAETLFRVFEIFRRASFHQHAFCSDNRNLLDARIGLIRSLRAVETLPSDYVPQPAQRWRIARLERYDVGSVVNAAHWPLELGDIFETMNLGADDDQTESRIFILLAQPCDLMVRREGKRSAKSATLVQVTFPATASDSPDERASFELDYFDPESGKIAFAKFRSAYQISTDVLDLCVLHEDGSCALDPAHMPTGALHTPWQKRFAVIQNVYSNHSKNICQIQESVGAKKLSSAATQYLERSLAARITQSSLNIKFTYEPGGAFKFGLRRIGRFRQPGATALLSQYVAFLSRNAAEHDFAK
jgi:hypothetical protein